MSGLPDAGTFVEVQMGSAFVFAVVVEPPAEHSFSDTGIVWVRYVNNCVAPVREYYVRALSAQQVLAKLNAR